jgi:DNA (cytosine-5)-methyltransferase 1
VFYELVKECQPGVIMGEQVSGISIIGERSPSKTNRKEPVGAPQPTWFDTLASDLEAAHYSVGAASLSASAVGAPHIRQRLYWVGLKAGSLGVADRARRLPWCPAAVPAGHGGSAEPTSDICELADPGGAGLWARRRRSEEGDGAGSSWEQPGRLRDAGESFWGSAEWIPCIDGKWRPIEAPPAKPELLPVADGIPGGLEQSGRAYRTSQDAESEEARSTFPVVHGYPNRIGALRGYGNAIVPPLAAVFIQSVMGD